MPIDLRKLPAVMCILETLRLANSRCANRCMNPVKTHSVRGKGWPCASTSGGMFVSSARFAYERKRRAAAGNGNPITAFDSFSI